MSPFAPRKSVFFREGMDNNVRVLSRSERRQSKATMGDLEMLGEIFDPKAETLIYEHCRPHWSQAGAVVFITFRTHDSIPREVIDR